MEDRPPSPIDKLTIPGRLLLIGSLVLFGIGFYFAFIGVEDWPAGTYPLFVILMPVGFGTCIFYFGGAWILERLGVQIYVRKPKE